MNQRIETQEAAMGGLPPEMVHHIIERVPKLATVAAASACCRLLNGVAQEIIQTRLAVYAHKHDVNVTLTPIEWLARINDAIALDKPKLLAVLLHMSRVCPDAILPAPDAITEWTESLCFAFMTSEGSVVYYADGQYQVEPTRNHHGARHFIYDRDVRCLKDDLSNVRQPMPPTLVVRAIDCHAARCLHVLLRIRGRSCQARGGWRCSHQPLSTESLLTYIADSMWPSHEICVARHKLPSGKSSSLLDQWTIVLTRPTNALAMIECVSRHRERSPSIAPMDVNPLFALRRAGIVDSVQVACALLAAETQGASGARKGDLFNDAVFPALAILLRMGYSPDEPISQVIPQPMRDVGDNRQPPSHAGDGGTPFPILCRDMTDLTERESARRVLAHLVENAHRRAPYPQAHAQRVLMQHFCAAYESIAASS